MSSAEMSIFKGPRLLGKQAIEATVNMTKFKHSRRNMCSKTDTNSSFLTHRQKIENDSSGFPLLWYYYAFCFLRELTRRPISLENSRMIHSVNETKTAEVQALQIQAREEQDGLAPRHAQAYVSGLPQSSLVLCLLALLRTTRYPTRQKIRIFLKMISPFFATFLPRVIQ